MAQSTILNGITYSIPDPGDTGWGAGLTAFLVAIAPGVLQKTGGTFTLTSDIDFGAAFGLKSSYFSSRSANPASTGLLRGSNTDTVSFRNFLNNGDLSITTDASDNLTYTGTKVLLSGAVVNADINASAAIAYSKLNLSNSIVNADINSAAAIDATKLANGSVSNTEFQYLDGVTSALQTQLDSKAPLNNPTFTGQVNFPLGSESTPGLSLTGLNTGFYNPLSTRLGVSVSGGQSAEFQATTPNDDVTSTPFRLFSGTSSFSGVGKATIDIKSQTTSVTTAAKTIFNFNTGTILGGLLVVTGIDSGFTKTFTDLLLFTFSTVAPTVVSANNSGTPAARTYAQAVAGVITLQMASGTYSIQSSAVSLSGR